MEDGFAQQLLASMGSGLIGVDASGALLVLNPAAARVLGVGAEGRSWRGRDCGEVLAHQPTLVKLLRDVLAGAEPPGRAELRLEPGPDRARCTIGFTVVPVRDAGGALRGAALLFRDLTPLEREGERERLRERLAALGEMAAGLAHELRNPLASLEVLVGLLRRELAEGSEPAALASEIRDEIHALTHLVNASLDFVKPAVPARTAVALAVLLREAVERAVAQTGFDGSVRCELEEPLPELVADADQLRAVFGNLIVNACEAMQRAGGEALRIEACVSRRDPDRLLRLGPEHAVSDPPKEVVVRVADDGPGVPERLRERIFYPFFTTHESGSGIGLALAQKWVASHGGSLELEPSRERGACFRVRLPLAEETS